jgi:hypothetical protein
MEAGVCYPLLRGGVAAPCKEMSRYLKTGRSGGGQTLVATEWSDLS